MATPSVGCPILTDSDCLDDEEGSPFSAKTKVLLMIRITQHISHKFIITFITHPVSIHVYNPLDNPYLLLPHLMERPHKLNHFRVYKQAVLILR